METRIARRARLLDIAKAAAEFNSEDLPLAEVARRVQTTVPTLHKARQTAKDAANDNQLIAELSPETLNALRNIGISNLEDLLAADPRVFKRAPGFGPVGMAEIEALLKRHKS